MNETNGLTFPLWTLVYSEQYKARGLRFSVVLVGSKGFGMVLPIFTTEMGATLRAAVREEDQPMMEPCCLPDAAALQAAIIYDEGALLTHAAINPGPSLIIPAERYVHFRDLLAAIGR